jgi:hypothetical protein
MREKGYYSIPVVMPAAVPVAIYFLSVATPVGAI